MLFRSAVLLSSCDGYLIPQDTVNNEDLADIGDSALSISLSNEDTAYLSFLNKLGNEIVENPAVANEFVENPQRFIEKYGFHQEINLDENMLHYILALGDVDVNKAVKSNNIDNVLEIMLEKGYIQNKYTKLNITNEQITQINKNFFLPDSDTYGNPTTQSVALAYSAIYAIAAVISQAAAIYNVAAAINAAAAINLGVWINVKVWTKGSQGPPPKSNKISIEILQRAVDQNLSIKAIQHKTDNGNMYVIADLAVEKIASQVVNLMKQYQPQIVEKYSTDELTQLIKLQMFTEKQ